MTSGLFRQQLSVWADFNSLDHASRIKASLRFADAPTRPFPGDRIRLYDDDGNAVVGVVEEISNLIIHVRPEVGTYSSFAIEVDDPFASYRTFAVERHRRDDSFSGSVDVQLT